MNAILRNRWVVLALGLGALAAVANSLWPLFVDGSGTGPQAQIEDDGDLFDALLFDDEAEVVTATLPQPTRSADYEYLANLPPSRRNPFALNLPGDGLHVPAPSEVVGLGYDKTAPAPADTLPVPEVGAVALAHGGRAALIAGHVVAVGDEVAGWIVQAIESQGATLQRGDRWARILVPGSSHTWKSTIPHELNEDLRWESSSSPRVVSHEETASLEGPAPASLARPSEFSTTAGRG